MKKILLLLITFSFLTSHLFADEDKVRMRPRDRFIFDMFIDVWQNTPEKMDLEIFNRGVNIALLQDFPLGYSNFSIATGLSFTSHNLYSDHFYKYSIDDNGYDFEPIDEELSYDNNKISLNYIDVPVEFRFRTRPSRDMPHPFRVAVGAKFGYKVQAHTKYEGEYYLDDNNANNALETREVKFKEHNLSNIESWRYGIMARIGYGYFNITGYYPLTNIFESNSGEEMRPISIGLSFIIN